MFLTINIDSITSFIGTIISLTFAVYYLTYYLSVKKERHHLTISIFMFSLMIYLSGYAMYSSSIKPETVLFWTRICYSGGAVIILTGYLLCSEITQTKSVLLIYAVSAVVFLLLILIFYPTDLFFTDVLNPEKSHSSVIKGSFFPVILLIIFVSDFVLILRFVFIFIKNKKNIYFIKPIIAALLFWFLEAIFDGIFAAVLSLSNKSQSFGPLVMIFSLALYSSRYSEKKNRELKKVKEENRQINLSLIYDSLSNLYSREYFIQMLTQRIALAEREEINDCLMFIDVDYFKTINDELGHDQGDRVIKFVGDILQLHSRRTDICARYGGDEFLILLENCHIDESIKLADSIRRNFSKGLPSLLKNWNGCKNVTLSIGVLDYHQWTDEPEKLIKRADLAMYEAKGRGKNSTVLFTQEMESEKKISRL